MLMLLVMVFWVRCLNVKILIMLKNIFMNIVIKCVYMIIFLMLDFFFILLFKVLMYSWVLNLNIIIFKDIENG